LKKVKVIHTLAVVSSGTIDANVIVDKLEIIMEVPLKTTLGVDV
jgi:hypothetical protein